MYIFVRMRLFWLTSDAIDGLCIVYSKFEKNSIKSEDPKTVVYRLLFYLF